MSEKDYYKILTVGENAGRDQIKKAYRNLAFRYHPDKNPGGEAMMKEINEAYAVLSDPGKKREYDALRQTYGSFARDQFRRAHSEQDIFRGSDIGQVFAEFSKAFGFSRPEDIFSRNNFYGANYRTFEFKRPGFSGSGFFFFGPMSKVYRAVPGQRHTLLSMLVVKVVDFLQKQAAKKLGLDLPERGKDLHDVIGIAHKQALAGGKVPYIYRKHGNDRNLLITVPPQIREGQKIKLKGLGQEGRRGGEAGDLYLKVRIHTPLLDKIKTLFGKR